MKNQVAAVIIAIVVAVGAAESVTAYSKALTAAACVKSGGSWLLKWNNIGYCTRECK